MKKLLWLLLLIPLPSMAVTPVYVSYNNWCMVGGQKVTVQGLTSTTVVQASYPSCTVTVYIHGGGLAALYSNKTGTSLSNPFTAQTNGSYEFYIDTTVTNEYDIVTSAGTPPFPSAVTLSDVFIIAPLSGGGGGNVNICPTSGGSVAYYATSGQTVSCIGADLLFATDTLTGGSALTVDFHNATQFRVPVSAGATASAAGVVDYDSTNKSTHFQTNNADSVGAAFAANPAGGKVLKSSGTTGLLSEATAYTDIVALWASGSCSGYLKNDGTCSTPSGGTVTSVATTAPITGGTITTSGTIACATCATETSPANGIARTASASQNIVGTELSGDATTSGSNSVTLATVNSNVGSFTSANITVNAKGLITAAANGTGTAPGGSNTQVQYNNSSAFGGISGATTDGTNLSVTTQTAGDNTTKAASDAFVTTAVNNAIAGVNPAVAVLAASTASLTGTYSNGVAGVGATFTVTATGAFTLDGVSISTIGQRVLLKNQSSAFQNGVYFATVVGALAVSPVFTRALDYDQPSDINTTGAIPVQSGTVNSTTSWLLTSTVNTIGTDALTYVQFSLNPSTLVTASSPGAGIARFAGSTQTVTSAELSGAVTTSGSNATTLAASYRTRSCEVVWGGSGATFALTSGDDAIANQSCMNKLGVTETIAAVYCRSDAGSNTTTINPTFGTSGTGTTICSGALTCGSSGAYSSTCTVSNGALTDGSNINPVMGGTLTGTSIHMLVVYTLP